MIQALLTLTLGVAMPAQDPPQSPTAFNRKVTLRFIEPDGTEKFIMLAGLKARTHVNDRTGEMMWTLESKPPRRMMGKGDLVIPEDGEDKGTVYRVTRSGGTSGRIVAVEKQDSK